MFDNESEFKQHFTPLAEDSNTKPVLKKIKNSQANSLADRVYQVILNMVVTKDLDKKVFDYVDPLGETLEYTA